ncbi:MAG: penicillin-binding protein activator [Betaproteobacteria bacterium]|nr:penicillin-binding protein activator [Betaproteobacteria bacterium]
MVKVLRANAILALFFALFAAWAVAQPQPPAGDAGWSSPEPSVQERLDAVEAQHGGKAPSAGKRSTSPSKTTPSPKAATKTNAKATIALILPGKSPLYGGAAQVVEVGFMAAAEAAHAKDSCLVIEHGDGDVAAAFQQATDAGVSVIVGPLVRDDLKTLLAMPPLAWTISLTQFEVEDAKLPSNLFALTLTVESDARYLAREIFIERRDGTPVVLSNETPLMKRFADAFIDEWLHLGEKAPERVIFSADDVAKVKAQLEALSPSVVVLAVEGNDAALARTQTKAWPTYASGHIYQRQEQFEAAALEGLRVVEIPWLVTPQAARFKALPTLPTAPAVARLYALGYDAFQTAEAFTDGLPMAMSLEGATGSLRFGRKEGLMRTGQLAEFKDGRLQPLELQPVGKEKSKKEKDGKEKAEKPPKEAPPTELKEPLPVEKVSPHD